MLLKSQVKAHTRTLKSGAVSNVREYTDKRIKTTKESVTKKKQGASKSNEQISKRPSIEEYKKEFPNDPLRFILVATVYGLLDKEDQGEGGEYIREQLDWIINHNLNTNSIFKGLELFSRRQYARNKTRESGGYNAVSPKSTANILSYFKGYISVGGLNQDYLKDYIEGQPDADEKVIEKQWNYAKKNFTGSPVIAKAKERQVRTKALSDDEIEDIITKKLGKRPVEPRKPAPLSSEEITRNNRRSSLRSSVMWKDFYDGARKYKALRAKYEEDMKEYEPKAKAILKEIKERESRKMESKNKS